MDRGPVPWPVTEYGYGFPCQPEIGLSARFPGFRSLLSEKVPDNRSKGKTDSKDEIPRPVSVKSVIAWSWLPVFEVLLNTFASTFLIVRTGPNSGFQYWVPILGVANEAGFSGTLFAVSTARDLRNYCCWIGTATNSTVINTA